MRRTLRILPFNLRLGRSQLPYFLLGALADVISTLFRVRSIVGQQFHSSLCILQRQIFLTICEVSIRQTVIYRSVKWGTSSH